MLHQTRKKLSPVARDSVVRCLLDDKHVFLATDSSNWVTIIVGFRYRFYGALMLDTHKMIHYMYLGGVKWQHIASCCWSRAGNFNRRSSGILLSPVRNCLARSVSRASWRCVAAHSSRHVIFVVAPSSVFPRVAVCYVFCAQGLNTIRAQSTCQKLSLSVPIMGPLLVPRFGAKKMSPHSGETYSRPRFRVCFWFLKWGRDLDPGDGIHLPRCTASAGCVTTCRRMLDEVVEYV